MPCGSGEMRTATYYFCLRMLYFLSHLRLYLAGNFGVGDAAALRTLLSCEAPFRNGNGACTIIGLSKTGICEMTYMGHVENGGIVLDEPVALPNGVTVKIELAVELPGAGQGGTEDGKTGSARFPLRGMAYRYDAPLDPAIPEHEWAVNL